jgi:hypothetical protein
MVCGRHCELQQNMGIIWTLEGTEYYYNYTTTYFHKRISQLYINLHVYTR